MKMARLLVLRTDRLYPQETFLVLISVTFDELCSRLVRDDIACFVSISVSSRDKRNKITFINSSAFVGSF